MTETKMKEGLVKINRVDNASFQNIFLLWLWTDNLNSCDKKLLKLRWKKYL